MIRIGSRVPDGIPEALLRDLGPMLRAIRATQPALAARAIQGREAAERALQALHRSLSREWSDKKLEALMLRRGAQILTQSDKDWAQLANALRGRPAGRRDALRLDALPNGRALLRAWAKVSTAQIKSVRDSVIPGLRRDLLHAIEHDWTPEQLAKAWARKKIPLEWGTLEGRTKVIAHTELRGLQAEIQRERSTAVGVTQFRWMSQDDDRVRDEHERLHGTVHDWGSPPSEGLPGQPPNCRCWAESIVTDDLLSNLGIAALAA